MTLTEVTLMETITRLHEQLDDAMDRYALLERCDAANAELAELALRQRDEYKHQLRELLAVIHGDGGHHTEARGIPLSCLDAREKYIQSQRELEELRWECGSLRRRFGGGL